MLAVASCNQKTTKSIMEEDLIALGFTRRNERPPIFRGQGKIGVFSDLLGFKVADLKPLPSQPRNSDIREGSLRGVSLTVRTKVTGELASKSLNDSETPCIIDVQFPHK